MRTVFSDVWNNTAHSTHNVSHGSNHPLDDRPILQYFFIACLAMQSIFGTVGNILVMGAVCVVPELRTTSSAFIVNLSLADIFITAVAQPSNILLLLRLGALYGEEWFQHRPILCSVISTLCATGCLASTWNIFTISVNRYVLICHHDIYDKVFTRWHTILLCLAIWILIYMIELPNHVGWGDNRFSEVFYVCTFANHVHSYAIFYIGVGVSIPIVLTFLAYLGIYRRVKDSNLVRHRLLSGGEMRTREERVHRKQRQRLFRQNVKVARALFRVYIIFIIMWLPVAVVIVLGRGKEVDPLWYILTILLAHGNSSINCLVYGASIDHFRQGYLIILGVPQAKLLRCQSRSRKHYKYRQQDTYSLQSADLEESLKKSTPGLDELEMTDLSKYGSGSRLCSTARS